LMPAILPSVIMRSSLREKGALDTLDIELDIGAPPSDNVKRHFIGGKSHVLS